MSEPVLRVEDLRVNYDDFIAVESASLSIEEGKIVSVVGLNGAGKSTLMNTIAGLNKPKSGKVFFMGKDITELPAEKIAACGLSLVPQGGSIFNSMSVQDNLLMGAYSRKASSAEQTACQGCAAPCLRPLPCSWREKEESCRNFIRRPETDGRNRQSVNDKARLPDLRRDLIGSCPCSYQRHIPPHYRDQCDSSYIDTSYRTGYPASTQGERVILCNVQGQSCYVGQIFRSRSGRTKESILRDVRRCI